MEAVGLAAGIVSLGLDLGTRLQTYVEGVKGAGDRLSAIAADVSATASIVRQLADLLTEADSLGLFTDQGVSDIDAILRRCRRAYGVIVDVLLGVTKGASSRTHAVLTVAGLSELTAARLARLSSRARWPWLEPRVKACQTELRAVKMDLLLVLHVAGLARHRMSRKETVADGADLMAADDDGKAAGGDEKDHKEGKGDEDDEGAALLGLATKLLEKRRRGGGSSSSSLSSSSRESDGSATDEADEPPKTPKSRRRRGSPTLLKYLAGVQPAGAPRTTTDTATQTVPRTASKTASQTSTQPEAEAPRAAVPAHVRAATQAAPPPFPRHPRLGLAGLVEGMSIGSLSDAGRDREAWLIGWDTPGVLFTVPVRGPSIEAILRTHEGDTSKGGESPSTLAQFLLLKPAVRWATSDVMDRVQRRDARVRTLVGLFTPATHPELPETCEALMLVSAGDEEQVVHLEDLEGRAWRVPFYELKTALGRAEGEDEVAWILLKYCDGGSLWRGVGVDRQRFRLCVAPGDAQAGEADGELLSLCGLHDYLRPGLRIRMKEDEIERRRRQDLERGALVVEVYDRKERRNTREDLDFEWVRKKDRSYTGTDVSDKDSKYEELFGEEAEGLGVGGMEGLQSVEDLLARWTCKEAKEGTTTLASSTSPVQLPQVL